MIAAALILITRLLILTGEDAHHDWQRTTPVLKSMLEQDGRFEVDVLSDLAQMATVDFDAYAAVIVHFKNDHPDVPGRVAFERLNEYVRGGGGLVSVHFGCGAFEEFEEEYRDLLGRSWFGLPAPTGKRQHDPYGFFGVAPTMERHAITEGLAPFTTSDELYTCLTGDGKVKVLAEALSPLDSKNYPMAMVHRPGQGRVFLCTLGHNVDAYQAAGVGDLYRRGAAWAAGIEPVVDQSFVGTGPDQYDVVWTTPSADSSGSMPLGNGEIGINAWMDEAGVLSFYISKTDSWSENGRLLKVGRVRVTTDPPLLSSMTGESVEPSGNQQYEQHLRRQYEQRLHLQDGEMILRNGDVTLRLWVDANHPAVHVSIDGEKSRTATATIDLWRTVRTEYPEAEVSDLFEDRSKPNRLHQTVWVEPDTLMSGLKNQIGWYHYNQSSNGPSMMAERQGLAEFLQNQPDPLLHRIFGAVVSAKNGRRLSASQLESGKSKSHQFSVFVRTDHPATVEEWQNGIAADRAEFEQQSFELRHLQHQQWWRMFWQRSWIHLWQEQSSDPIPRNQYDLRVGMDQHGSNVFVGEIRDLRISSDNHLHHTDVAETGAITNSSGWTFADGLSIDATIIAGDLPGGGGRIVDKVTPGGSDGFLFDTYPNNSLRLIVGSQIIQAKNVLQKGVPAKVGARVNAASGALSILLNGAIVASSSGGESINDAQVVGRAYALQRWVDACAGRGNFPIKFNGSIFTVPHPGKFGDADYRRWGPGYWWQNTRLPYLSMCASGDAEMMKPLFTMYAEQLMPLNVYRTKKYTGHGGAFLPECINFWGPIFTATYGWTPFSERNDKLQDSRYHKWEWVSGLELVWMMLDYVEHTEDWDYLKQTVLPSAFEFLTFFDQHSELDENGKLIMTPSQALETWWDTTNPMPEVAGLHAVTQRLLDLDALLTSPAQREFWLQLKNKTPDVPTWLKDGVELLAPAERFEQKANVENPELYAVFPFRLVSFEKDNAALGERALEHRWDRGASGWRQDDLFMTYLGLADQARANLVSRARNKHAGSRFPVFWGPNYDWIPDQDHGGVLMRTLQTMLMQTDGRKIYLLPAWPKTWSAEFKLHAPYQTTISGSVRDGKIFDLVVIPKSRRADIVLPQN